MTKKCRPAAALMLAAILCLCAASCSKKSDENAEDISELISVFSYDEESSAASMGAVYVLNKSTKKIHYLTCSAVDKMAAENYEETDDFSGAVSKGYEPCEVCSPS